MTACGFTAAMAAAVEFIDRSTPNLKLDRWLASRGVDVEHAWNTAGPICAHTVALWPSELFDFLLPKSNLLEFALQSCGNHVRAVVHIVRDNNDETPVDLIAW